MMAAIASHAINRACPPWRRAWQPASPPRARAPRHGPARDAADHVETIESSGSAGASAHPSAIPATTEIRLGPAEPLGIDCVGLVFTMTSSNADWTIPTYGGRSGTAISGVPLRLD